MLVIDPHGEYASALPEDRAQRIATGTAQGSDRLRVPYWALRFDELVRVSMGPLSEQNAEFVRECVRALKVEAAQHLAQPPVEQAITADSPIPFSIRRLWFELKDNEEVTFADRNDTRCSPVVGGDAEQLIAPEYPPAGAGSAAPFLNPQRRGMGRQLDFLRSRLLDSRFTFLFDADDGYHPDEQGRTAQDLDELPLS